MRFAAVALALTAAGCVPALDGAEEVLVYDYEDGALVPVERPLRIAPEDMIAGRSALTDILIGGEIVVQNAGIRVQGGRVPSLPARVEDGVLIHGDGDA